MIWLGGNVGRRAQTANHGNGSLTLQSQTSFGQAIEQAVMIIEKGDGRGACLAGGALGQHQLLLIRG